MERLDYKATIAGAIYPKCIVDVASKLQLGGQLSSSKYAVPQASLLETYDAR
jgi:hypothetical protein